MAAVNLWGHQSCSLKSLIAAGGLMGVEEDYIQGCHLRTSLLTASFYLVAVNITWKTVQSKIINGCGLALIFVLVVYTTMKIMHLIKQNSVSG